MNNDGKLDIVIDGPDALKQRFILPSPRFISPRRGFMIPSGPDIVLEYRLADLPALGVSTLKSNLWAFVAQLAHDRVKERLSEIGGPVRATLETRNASFIARNGERAGQTVSYSYPVLTILGPVATAEAATGSAGKEATRWRWSGGNHHEDTTTPQDVRSAYGCGRPLSSAERRAVMPLPPSFLLGALTNPRRTKGV